MIKKPNGRPEGFPKRPSKFSVKLPGDYITSRPHIPTFKQRLEAARTGYLSISSHLPEELKADLLEKVRLQFPNLRIGSFSTEFEDTKDWRNHIKSFLSDIDMLIVAHDQTRVVKMGVRREMILARHAQKLVILFDTEAGRWDRFNGYDLVEEDGKPRAVRLRDRKREKGGIHVK